MLGLKTHTLHGAAGCQFWSHVVHARFSKAKSVVSSSSVSPVKHVLSFSNFRKVRRLTQRRLSQPVCPALAC